MSLIRLFYNSVEVKREACCYQNGHPGTIDSGDHHGGPGAQKNDSTEDKRMFRVPENVSTFQWAINTKSLRLNDLLIVGVSVGPHPSYHRDGEGQERGCQDAGLHLLHHVGEILRGVDVTWNMTSKSLKYFSKILSPVPRPWIVLALACSPRFAIVYM